ncbi:Gfo/Idh/MocA family oxidoreductase [Muriicola sp. Z0-33]|uniref:Gfo/Idh/MocA family oxidoreductase n=1 Tax=Muriicola sp. Z0-33 TaxID=2816957 RepID=UPI0022380225|nr:Gfo/Idh/MocA family oxidoreductase [Muriicola sp. Z0-33]MCW5517641.1 Gfo/Idh/MocA family oxidoreductase [Muriicola sp. Z0-33]
MSEKINLCIVGLGRAGRFHLQAIKKLDSCSLKYVVDPGIAENDELVSSNNFTLLSEITPALSDTQLNGVIVSAPTQFHYEIICRALQAGKHVFTEKPLGKTATEIKTCFDLAKEKGLSLYLGFQRRYDTNFIALKKSLETIGQVRTIKMSSRDNPKPSLDYLKISGNIFHDMLIHDFDMLQFLLGDKVPVAVSAFGHAYDPEIKKIPDFDTVLVTLKFDDGLICAIDTSRIAEYGYDQRIELFAEKGMAIAENQKNNTVEVHTKKGSFLTPINYSFPTRYKDAYSAEIADFVAAIPKENSVNVSKRQCLIGHLIAQAAYNSAITNSVIDFKKEYAGIIDD